MYINNRNSSMDMIQSWMMICNKYVSKLIGNNPWLYRVQENIENEKLNEFLHEVKTIEGYDDNWKNSLKNDVFISKMFLNNIKKGKYSPLKEGHFMLGEDNYSHFTSPIRRYSDIINHRILLNYLDNKSIYCVNLMKDALHLSNIEKKSNILRDYHNNMNNIEFLKKIEYSFKGRILKIFNTNILVLSEFDIEGYLNFDSFEKINKLQFKIGDYIDIKIDKNELNNNNIKYELI